MPKPLRLRGPLADLKVDPPALALPPRTWRDALRHLGRAGAWGVVLSVAVHSLVMLVLALFVVELPGRGSRGPIFVNVINPDPTEPVKVWRKPVTLPITLPGTSTEIAKPQATTVVGTEPTRTTPGLRPVGVEGSLGQRGVGTGGDAGALERLGGSTDAQRAIKAGLGWLVRQQDRDGRWQLHQGYPDAGTSTLRTDTGATALALLAFLGAGQTPTQGEHAAVIRKGLRWLIDQQDPQTGDLHDQRQEEGRQPAFYAHALATIALCEALALTEDAAFREPAEKAVQYLLASQHPDAGGWKYRPISRMMVGDLSVTGWALMGLHTARMAGIDVADDEFRRASRFLDTVQEQEGSRYKYEPTDPPQRVTVALTAEGLLCRQWLGWPKDHPPLVEGVAFLREQPQPQWSGGRRNLYGWYYTAQVLHHLDSDDWRTWYPPVRDLVIRQQVTAGSTRSPNDIRGSWHPTQPPGAPEEYADKAGRLYLTTMCLLLLETPYRHRPLYGE